MRDPHLRSALWCSALSLIITGPAFAIFFALTGWASVWASLMGTVIGCAITVPLLWATGHVLARRRRRSGSDPIGEAMAEAAALQGSPDARTALIGLPGGQMPPMLYAPDGHLYSPGPDGKLGRVTMFGFGLGPGMSVDDLQDLEPFDGVEVSSDGETWRVIRHRYCWWRFWGRCRHAVLAERAVL